MFSWLRKAKFAIVILGFSAGTAAAQTDEMANRADIEAVAAGNTAFAIDIYRQLIGDGDGGNLFISPSSISSAVAMAYAGARGETAEQIAQTMYFTLPPDRFHAAMGDASSMLDISEDWLQLNNANALWIQDGLSLLPAFENITAEHYGAGVNRVDFISDHDAARETINEWVEERTQDRIQDLLAPLSVSERTRFVLTNAIYMNADWRRDFSANATAMEPFRTLSEEDVTADMMRQVNEFRHMRTRHFQAIELPYRGDALSMVVFLPRSEDGLGQLEQRLTEERLSRWIDDLYASDPVRVDLRLPRFRLEEKYELKDYLQQLGLILPFAYEADFFGISEDLQGIERFVIDGIVHQSFVEVDEQGTEAAAATAVVGVVVSGARRQPDPIAFHADHPFLFLIRDNRTGLIIFMGRLVHPEPAETDLSEDG